MRCRPWGLIALAAMLSSCHHPGKDESLVVLAAASLHESIGDLGADFLQQHPGTALVSTSAGTQTLVAQLRRGLRADVVATADLPSIEALEHEGRVEGATRWICNEPVLALALSSHLDSFAELPKAERVVLGAPEVPAGRYADQILAGAKALFGEAFVTAVRGHVVSREPDVRQVLAKLSLGEADAAIVYRTDVIAAQGRVRAVEIPKSLWPPIAYGIGAVKDAPHPALAREFIALATGPRGQALLGRRGFVACPTEAPR